MTIKLSSLRADLDKEKNGEWRDSRAYPGVRWHLRSTNYAPFVVARDAASRRLAKQYGQKTIPEEVQARVNGELAVKHLLLGWDGFDEGYTAETAEGVLIDPAYRDLRADVFACATEVGQSEMEFVEVVAKNSAPTSAPV